MSSEKQEPTEDELVSRTRAAMDRAKLIIQKVQAGEATEAELTEYKRIMDKVSGIPINTLTG